ncbi:MAG: hypothetical protein GXO47_13630, partial [Chlorobi bacterium]|nr:hypothetical protein [Chlorobiota bacterium]
TMKGTGTIAKISELKYNGHFELQDSELTIAATNSIKSLTIANENTKTILSVPKDLSYVLNGEVEDGSIFHYKKDSLSILNDFDSVSFSGEFGTEPYANIIVFNKSADIIFKQD